MREFFGSVAFLWFMVSMIILIIRAIKKAPRRPQRISTLVSFVYFFIYTTLPESGAGDAIATLLFIAAIVATIVLIRRDKLPEKKAKDGSLLKSDPETGEFIPPKRAPQQQALGNELSKVVRDNTLLASQTRYVSLYVSYHDKAVEALEKMVKLDKANFDSLPILTLRELQSEFQLNLCNTLVRLKKETIEEIDGKYRNSREYQEKALDEFSKDINRVRSRFSPGTADVADRCIAEIERHLGMNKPEPISYTKTMSSIDLMDGHDFEHWCAEVLRKNGFSDVEVTRGSGDQGVDVTAQKGGIRYAVQCKCYSSDLGNKPVQEVNTGKTIYHCQIGAVMTNRYFTSGAKQAAEATGVLLWDRNVVQQMAKNAGML